jgi:hypothetical protein
MFELKTEFLRSWMHCPLGAVLCSKHSIQPVDVAARRFITEALGAASPDGRSPRFKSDRVAKRFDELWTDFQERYHLMDLQTFYDIGAKMQARANAVANTVNKAIEDGWSFVDGAHEFVLPLDDLIGEEGRGWRLVHQVDMLLRDLDRRLCLACFSSTSTLRFINVRELNLALDIQLNNLVGARCVAETCRAVIISTNKERMLAATMDPADTERACGWLRDVVRALRAGVASHRTVSELNCGYCPVQGLCDDPKVYRSIQQEGGLVP